MMVAEVRGKLREPRTWFGLVDGCGWAEGSSSTEGRLPCFALVLRVSSVIDSSPRRVSRRRRVDLREPRPPSSAVVSVIEVSLSRAGVAGGSGFTFREGAGVVSRDSSSAGEAIDWDLVRVRREPATAEEAVLAARPC
jgi:hypothetical protein